MAVIVVFAMLQFVLLSLPPSTKRLTPHYQRSLGMIAIAHYSSQWSWLAVAFTMLSVMTYNVIKQKPYWRILSQKWLLGLPVTGAMVRGQKLTQIFTVLALTQNAGIPFLQGLESVSETLASPFWSQRLAQVHHDISAGKPVWLALKNCGEFSPLCIQLVRTGEASGSLDAMLRNLAHHHGRKRCLRRKIWLRYLSPRYWSLRV